MLADYIKQTKNLNQPIFLVLNAIYLPLAIYLEFIT